MKNRTDKYGLTLIEMLIVVGIIAILTSLVIGIARRIDNQSKERLAKNTIAVITSALTQFRDYGYDYNDINYRVFVFPLDCNGFTKLALETALANALDATNVVIGPVNAAKPISHNDPNLSGCEVLYFLLSQVPASRETLDKIDKSLLTDRDTDINRNEMKITVNSRDFPLLRVVDPWGDTLRYDYYNETTADPDSKRTFPVIISAGPDKIFGTMDDITSK